MRSSVVDVRRLSKPSEVWVLTATAEDRVLAADYAERTLPWTFNRMMLNTGPRGQCERALNIAKGLVGQEMLRRACAAKGIPVSVERKSHRDDDRSDFLIHIESATKVLDVKTVHHYTDYPGDERPPLTTKLVVDNAAYDGPDWRQFFPMMLTHTQIGQPKEIYCFAMASSADPRRVGEGAIGQRVWAFPYGPHLGFFGGKRLIQKREEAGRGFYVSIVYRPEDLLSAVETSLTVVGEWAGRMAVKTVQLAAGRAKQAGPFSVIDSFRMEAEDYGSLANGLIEVDCSRNDFGEFVPNTTGRDTNAVPTEALTLAHKDFCDLRLPDPYRLFVLGWITKRDFLEKCRNYRAWVWPRDSVNRFENQPWSPTADDLGMFRKLGFADRLSKKPLELRAGWLKTSGKGNGACCYVFPNLWGRAGVNENNLYVLPQDLFPMDELNTETVAAELGLPQV